MQKKQLIWAFVALIIIIGAALLFRRYKRTEYLPASASAASTEAFAALEGYQAALKNHDVSALKMYSYKISDVCANPASTTECQERMNSAETIVSHFFDIKTQFTNVWYDNKQTVLSTDYHLVDSTTTTSEVRSIIFFARDSSGHLKVAYFSQPDDLTTWLKIGDSPEDQIVLALEHMIIDSDADGLADQTETCTYLGADPKTCIKTDPHKRDTNGDGWWDSTEIFVK